MRGSVRGTVGGGGVSESSLLEGVCAVERCSLIEIYLAEHQGSV